MASGCFVITFDSTHQAIAMEKRLKGMFQSQLMPTPRQITSGCGFAIKLKTQDRAQLDGLLQEAEPGYHLYALENGDYIPQTL
ncbi:MAG: DUF3343 domain-containing protein [Firmicutes bacterium]|nr:DUF3343 domain-containing protein [Bacillota bacterium]